MTLPLSKQGASREEVLDEDAVVSACVWPVGPYAQGFWEELARRGYSGSTAQAQVYLMAHLSRWLVEQHVDPGELSAERLGLFLTERRASGRRPGKSLRGVGPLVGFLRGLGRAGRGGPAAVRL